MSRKLLLFYTALICLFTLVVSATSVNFTVRSDEATSTPTFSSGGGSGGDATFTPTPGGGGSDSGGGHDSNPSVLPSVSKEIDISSLGIENVDNNVRHIDVDKQGLIYLATQKGQIYILSAAGELMAQWKVDTNILDMKVDAQGNIYIVDGSYFIKYDNKGKLLLKFRVSAFIHFQTFAFTSKGNLVGVADYRSPKVNKTVEALFFFDRDGKQVKLVDQFLGDMVDTQFSFFLKSIAVGPQDDLYFVETTSPQNLVYHVDANGKYIDQFPINVGPFPSASAIDSKDRFYIGGFGGVFVLGTDHAQRGIVPLGEGAITFFSIAVGKNDTVYVCYQQNTSTPNAKAFVAILEWPQR